MRLRKCVRLHGRRELRLQQGEIPARLLGWRALDGGEAAVDAGYRQHRVRSQQVVAVEHTLAVGAHPFDHGLRKR